MQALNQRPHLYQATGLDLTSEPSPNALADLVAAQEGQRIICPLSDQQGLEHALQGMDALVHLAAVSDPAAAFHTILEHNISGSWNLLQAAIRQGVSRIIVASSLRVFWGHFCKGPNQGVRGEYLTGKCIPPALQREHPPYAPLEPYAAGKVWLEAAAALVAANHGIVCPVIRFGWVNPTNEPWADELAPIWCSHHTAVTTILDCLEKQYTLVSPTVHALSGSGRHWFRDTQYTDVP